MGDSRQYFVYITGETNNNIVKVVFSKIPKNMLISWNETIHRHGQNTTRHSLGDIRTHGLKSIPFEIVIKMPPQSKRGYNLLSALK